MLLFKPYHIKPILDETKTQTRRIWKKPRAKKGSIHQAKTSLYCKPFALIKILDVHVEKLTDISKEDLIKEGYPLRKEFFRIWTEINKKLNPDQEVYVISFKLVKKIG